MCVCVCFSKFWVRPYMRFLSDDVSFRNPGIFSRRSDLDLAMERVIYLYFPWSCCRHGWLQWWV